MKDLFARVFGSVCIVGAAAFGASHASAGTVIDLGSIYVTGTVDVQTCFDVYPTPCHRAIAGPGNAYAHSPYSQGTTTLNLSSAPSVTAVAEAHPEGGQGISADFSASAKAQLGLDYNFAILGPQNITVPIHIVSHAIMTITGELAPDGIGGVAVDNAYLDMEGPGLFVRRRGDIERNRDSPGAFDVDEVDFLQTNTVYGVGMSVEATAHAGTTLTTPDTIIATSMVDPSITIDDTGGAYSAYHIAYSSGVGGLNTVPLPASLPLFTSALGGLGFVGWRRRRRA